jgi:predicted phosphoadenosine phosphosulfate sulfurtransferase
MFKKVQYLFLLIDMPTTIRKNYLNKLKVNTKEWYMVIGTRKALKNYLILLTILKLKPIKQNIDLLSNIIHI